MQHAAVAALHDRAMANTKTCAVAVTETRVPPPLFVSPGWAGRDFSNDDDDDDGDEGDNDEVEHADDDDDDDADDEEDDDDQ